MRKTPSLIRSVVLLGTTAVGVSVAQPVPAQILGDADCPGGYSYNRAYGLCVPIGSTYVPNYYGYGNPYPPPFYGYGPYIIITPGDRDRHRDRDRDRDRDHDRDRR